MSSYFGRLLEVPEVQPGLCPLCVYAKRAEPKSASASLAGLCFEHWFHVVSTVIPPKTWL